MHRVLMILTSHRLDCFRLAMDLLEESGSLPQFDRVVLLLNGVTGRHRAYVDSLMADHRDVAWDTIAGPRGKGPLVANLQNECVRRYPDSLYFKIDEDVFVSRGWADKLAAAYESFRGDPGLALITPVIPNNAAGFFYLLNRFPELRAEYSERFPGQPVTSACDGPVWINAHIGEWIARKFIHLDQTNRDFENHTDFVKFAYRFNINCIVYDYRHWQELGGIPDKEEPAWGQWVPDHGKFDVLVTNTLVHHYSFFVQQDWMDRTFLIEDLRAVNLPETMPQRTLANYYLPRMVRIAQQLPRVAQRRIQKAWGS